MKNAFQELTDRRKMVKEWISEPEGQQNLLNLKKKERKRNF